MGLGGKFWLLRYLDAETGPSGPPKKGSLAVAARLAYFAISFSNAGNDWVLAMFAGSHHPRRAWSTP